MLEYHYSEFDRLEAIRLAETITGAQTEEELYQILQTDMTNFIDWSEAKVQEQVSDLATLYGEFSTALGDVLFEPLQKVEEELNVIRGQMAEIIQDAQYMYKNDEIPGKLAEEVEEASQGKKPDEPTFGQHSTITAYATNMEDTTGIKAQILEVQKALKDDPTNIEWNQKLQRLEEDLTRAVNENADRQLKAQYDKSYADENAFLMTQKLINDEIVLTDAQGLMLATLAASIPDQLDEQAANEIVGLVQSSVGTNLASVNLTSGKICDLMAQYGITEEQLLATMKSIQAQTAVTGTIGGIGTFGAASGTQGNNDYSYIDQTLVIKYGTGNEAAFAAAQAAIEAAKAEYNNAKTETQQQAAHDKAEAARQALLDAINANNGAGLTKGGYDSDTDWHIQGYSTGITNGPVTYTGLAMLHGTPQKPEYVLNNDQAYNLLSYLTSKKNEFMSSGVLQKAIQYIIQGDVILENCQDPQKFWNEVTKAMDNRWSITKNRR